MVFEPESASCATPCRAPSPPVRSLRRSTTAGRRPRSPRPSRMSGALRCSSTRPMRARAAAVMDPQHGSFVWHGSCLKRSSVPFLLPGVLDSADVSRALAEDRARVGFLGPPLEGRSTLPSTERAIAPQVASTMAACSKLLGPSSSRSQGSDQVSWARTAARGARMQRRLLLLRKRQCDGPLSVPRTCRPRVGTSSPRPS